MPALLGLGLYDTPSLGTLLLDLAPRARGVRLSTGEHGFAAFECFYPCTLADAFRLYDRPGLPHVAVTWQGGVVWEGRLEDVAIVDGGVRLAALGYWRALYDVPYTALWSRSGVTEWRPIAATDISGRNAELYHFDTLNRLQIDLVKNNVYINNGDIGAIGYFSPDDGAKPIKYLTLDYDYNLPTDWVIRVIGFNSANGGVELSNIDVNGGSGTGTKTWSITANTVVTVVLEVYNLTGSSYTMAGETGSFYARATNVRATTTDGTVYADEIAAGLVSFVNGINSSQLASATSLISSPAVDLKDEVYEDAWPADILDHLAGLGDNASPTQLYEAGVWENRLLVFRQRAVTRTWYVDASSLEVERTLETLRNSAYVTYQEAAGRPLRTAVSADSNSVARWGLTRRQAVRADTSDSNIAGALATLTKNDKGTPRPRTTLAFRELYDATGVRWPLWMARAWDKIVIRNLLPSLSTDIDRIRSFRVKETEYDADGDVLTVTPEAWPARADLFLARIAAGADWWTR